MRTHRSRRESTSLAGAPNRQTGDPSAVSARAREQTPSSHARTRARDSIAIGGNEASEDQREQERERETEERARRERESERANEYAHGNEGLPAEDGEASRRPNRVQAEPRQAPETPSIESTTPRRRRSTEPGQGAITPAEKAPPIGSDAYSRREQSIPALIINRISRYQMALSGIDVAYTGNQTQRAGYGGINPRKRTARQSELARKHDRDERRLHRAVKKRRSVGASRYRKRPATRRVCSGSSSFSLRAWYS